MRRTIGLLIAGGLSALLTFGYLIYVGRMLGPSQYAEFSTSLAFIYLVAIAVSPLTPAIARVAARRFARHDIASIVSLRRGVMRPFATALLASAFVLALPVYVLARVLRFESPVPLFLAFACALSFALLSADRGFLQGLFRFGAYNGSVLIESLVRLVSALVVFQLAGPSASGALAGYLAAIVAAELFNHSILNPRDTSANDPVDWREIRRLVVPMMALMIAAALYQNIDMILIKRWFPAVVAGQYGAAAALAKMFGAVFTPLYVLLGPVLTQHHERGEALAGPAIRVAGIFAALSSVGFLLLLFRGEEIVRLLFGAPFAPAAWVAAHLGAVSILLHVSLLLTQVFITVHDFGFLRWFATAAAIQVLGLVVFHRSLGEVLVVLYVAQVALIVPVSVQLFRSARRST